MTILSTGPVVAPAAAGFSSTVRIQETPLGWIKATLIALAVLLARACIKACVKSPTVWNMLTRLRRESEHTPKADQLQLPERPTETSSDHLLDVEAGARSAHRSVDDDGAATRPQADLKEQKPFAIVLLPELNITTSR